MNRHNSEGIPREDLMWALGQRRLVMTARRMDSCMLCRSSRVNEAGLCTYCWSLLRDEEIRLAESWLNGTGP